MVAVVDRRTSVMSGTSGTVELGRAGIATYRDHHVVRAHGTRHVRSLTIAHNTTGKKSRISCDLVCISGPYQPESALLQQAGCRMSYDADLGETVPTNLPQGVYAVGDVTGIHDLGRHHPPRAHRRSGGRWDVSRASCQGCGESWPATPRNTAKGRPRRECGDRCLPSS